MELSVMDRINLILSDPEKATMTLAQIVSEEIREFKMCIRDRTRPGPIPAAGRNET